MSDTASCLPDHDRSPSPASVGEHARPVPPAGLAYAYGKPLNTGLIKAEDDDFRVDEILSFTPNGNGEHVFLRIEKTGENTEYVARQLARFASVPSAAIGYAGLKDRHGRTCQWFSVSLPGKAEPDWSAFDTPSLRILEVSRNQRKLRRGAIAGNRFHITVRSLTGPRSSLEERLCRIKAGGVPNYFGPQRFGRGGHNVGAAAHMLTSGDARGYPRHKRSLYLSAARAYLFNLILTARVEAGSWNRAIAGDVFMFSTGHSLFRSDAGSEEIVERIARMEIHPAGTLWGSGDRLVNDQARVEEDQALTAHTELRLGLEREGLRMAMRALRISPVEFQWHFPVADTLELQFNLSSGAYATSLLRELIDTDDTTLPEPVDED